MPMSLLILIINIEHNIAKAGSPIEAKKLNLPAA